MKFNYKEWAAQSTKSVHVKFRPVARVRLEEGFLKACEIIEEEFEKARGDHSAGHAFLLRQIIETLSAARKDKV